MIMDEVMQKRDRLKKEEWDAARRMPLPERYWGSAYSRAHKLYDILEGQYFFRQNDGMIIRIDYVSTSHLVLALDVRTHEHYRCYEMDFSTKEVTFVKDRWEDKCLVWTRISEQDAKVERARYRNKKIKDGLKALLSFWR